MDEREQAVKMAKEMGERAGNQMREIVENISSIKGEHYAMALEDFFRLNNAVECLMTIVMNSPSMQDSETGEPTQPFKTLMNAITTICYTQMRYVVATLAYTDIIVATKDEAIIKLVSEKLPENDKKAMESFKRDMETLCHKMEEFKGMFMF